MIQTILIALLLSVLGIAMLFLGYRFFRTMIPFWGFFAGFSAGAEGTRALMGTGFLADITGWIVGFIVGIVLAFLAYAFYKWAVVLLGVSLGYSIGAGLMAAFGLGGGFVAAVVGIVLGLFMGFGFLLLNIPKTLLIVYTAAAGAGALLAGVLLLLGIVPLNALGTGVVGLTIAASWVWALIWLLLSAVGTFIQTRGNLTTEYQPY